MIYTSVYELLSYKDLVYLHVQYMCVCLSGTICNLFLLIFHLFPRPIEFTRPEAILHSLHSVLRESLVGEKGEQDLRIRYRKWGAVEKVVRR